MSKILITGSKGCIGTALTKKLKEQGHSVYGIDLTHETSLDSYQRCDISEYRQLERVFDNSFDLVYNCAAEFGRWNGEAYYEQLWKTNVIGLRHLLQLQDKYKFKLVHFSSSEVYGDYDSGMSEEVLDKYPIGQLNDYALTKRVNELQIKNCGNKNVVIIRLFNVYGPGEYYHHYRSVNSRFCYYGLNKKLITVYTGHKRSSTYIDNAINALSNIPDRFDVCKGKIYNIGGNELHTIEELAYIVQDYLNIPDSLFKYTTPEKRTTLIKVCDNSLAVKDLDFKQTVRIYEGMRLTIDWMKYGGRP